MKIAKSKAPDMCVAYRCQNKKYRTDRFCHRHRHMYRKETDPVKYFWRIWRTNANSRGISFEISLEWFREFCTRTNFINEKGKTATSASLDRKDPRKGYAEDNIQVLTLADNTRKMHRDNNDIPF